MINATQRLEDLRQLAAKTAQEMARLDALFLSIGDGAIATDETGKITRINQAALSILKFSEKELLGRQFTECIVATDNSGVLIPEDNRPIAISFRDSKTVTRRCYYLRRDGSHVPVAVTVSPIMLDNQPVGAVEVFRDISEELQLDKIKSEFISIASHELRTPATAVKTYLGMLIEGYAGELTPPQIEFLKMAYEGNERQLSILSDLLYVSKTESTSVNLKKKKIDFAYIIQNVVDAYQEAIQARNQRVVLALDKDTCVNVDPSFMRIVTENLLSNASKYTPQGGRITISLTDKPNKVILAIRDNGVGIDDAEMDKLFKKFSRIDNSLSTEVGGSGIGLYLVKQIVELHDGKIKASSKVGSGSKFTVTLPK